MKKALKYLSYTGLMALALPAQAASVITGNNSFVEGYLYVEDTLGNSVENQPKPNFSRKKTINTPMK